ARPTAAGAHPVWQLYPEGQEAERPHHAHAGAIWGGDRVRVEPFRRAPLVAQRRRRRSPLLQGLVLSRATARRGLQLDASRPLRRLAEQDASEDRIGDRRSSTHGDRMVILRWDVSPDYVRFGVSHDGTPLPVESWLLRELTGAVGTPVTA